MTLELCITAYLAFTYGFGSAFLLSEAEIATRIGRIAAWAASPLWVAVVGAATLWDWLFEARP